jgi:endonuclease/exonuclease/phosphatase family metal-dependent hydrolase
MRIVSYNIYNGGEGRADPLAEVILAQRPDVVALVEADDPATTQRIARRLKMDFIEAPGRKHTSALLSRFPITETINHGLNQSFLEAMVLDDGGVEWPIGVLHLPAGATEADEVGSAFGDRGCSETSSAAPRCGAAASALRRFQLQCAVSAD